MRFLKDMERVIQNNGERGLEHLEFYYGVDLAIIRSVAGRADIYSKVHGKNRGKEGVVVDKIVGILASDDFFAADDAYTGGFELGFLYTRSDKVIVGDTLQIDSSDGKIRRFKVESKEDIGFTQTIFKKWKLSNLGD
jgi:hypothetical protein